MTPQEIFDTVAKHLFAQGRRALRTRDLISNSCAYRSPNGDKCAVGCLIPDDVYDSNMEGYSVDELLPRFKKLPEWFFSNLDLLRQLQSVHDFNANWAGSARLKHELTSVAEQFNLSTVVLNDLRLQRDTVDI